MLNSQTCSRTMQRKGNVNSYSPCATCGGSWQEERWLLPCWVGTWISAMTRQRKRGNGGGNGGGPCSIKAEGFLKHPKYKINLESNSTTRRSIDIIVIQVNQTSWNTYLLEGYLSVVGNLVFNSKYSKGNPTRNIHEHSKSHPNRMKQINHSHSMYMYVL